MKGDIVKILTSIISATLVLLPHDSLALDLQKGVIDGHPNWHQLTSVDREAGYHPKSVVESDEDGIVYVFDGGIGKTDLNQGKLLSGWPLSRWENEFIEDEVKGVFYHGRQWPGTQDYFGDLTGCMAKTPMRYGDFSGDGSSEIILFLPDEFTLDMLVFSPEKGRVIFSSPISTTNSIAIDEADQSILNPDPARHYQYYLKSGQVIAGMGGAMTPAIRAYGKIYIDDFNKDGRHDLLLWRKLYRSLPASSQTPGFEKLRETWLHYTMIDGEYQRQKTSESTIRGWLTANSLTWRKGFPSNSECAGEEGELILEMHDPLLNDPDVLQ